MSDAEVLVLCQENNEDALNFIYKKYQKIIEKTMKYYKGVFNINNLSDLKTVGLISINTAIRCYNDNMDASFETFLKLILKRNIIKIYIKEFKKTQKEVPLFDALSDAFEDGEINNPLIKLIDDENVDLLKNDFKNTLSKGEKIIYEYLIKGYKYSEIKELLNLDIKQIYNAINRIKTKLKLFIKSNDCL